MLTHNELKQIITDRLNDVYEMKKQEGKEPIQAFRETPEEIQREIKSIIDNNWEWDSDWK